MVADPVFAFLITMGITALTVLACIFIHYEALYGLSKLLPCIHFLPNRMKLMVAVVGVFLAHTVEVWVFAFAYVLLVHGFGIGGFAGLIESGTPWFMLVDDYVYFSVVAYTSLGFGDIHPLGPARLLAGVEALTGLLLIGWSASFTYLMMEKYWSKAR